MNLKILTRFRNTYKINSDLDVGDLFRLLCFAGAFVYLTAIIFGFGLVFSFIPFPEISTLLLQLVMPLIMFIPVVALFISLFSFNQNIFKWQAHFIKNHGMFIISALTAFAMYDMLKYGKLIGL